MDYGTLARVIVTAVIGLVIASAASVNQDVIRNKVRIQHTEEKIHQIGKQVNEIHWYLLRRKKCAWF